MSRFPALSFSFVLVLSAMAGAEANTQAPDCEAHAAAAGEEEGIPDGILPAIARVESARDGRAWPWTLNQGGKGSYHATKQAALERLAEILATGEKNVDLGCMQLNWRWHAAEFPDAATMMDPVANTRYSARFLKALKERHGDWDSAVAAYHSNQQTRGDAYEKKVSAARDMILAEQGAGMSPRVPVAGMAPEPKMVVAGLTRGLLAWSGRPLVAAPGPGDLRRAGGHGALFPGAGPAVLTAGN
jgi:hypothetical protein